MRAGGEWRAHRHPEDIWSGSSRASRRRVARYRSLHQSRRVLGLSGASRSRDWDLGTLGRRARRGARVPKGHRGTPSWSDTRPGYGSGRSGRSPGTGGRCVRACIRPRNDEKSRDRGLYSIPCLSSSDTLSFRLYSSGTGHCPSRVAVSVGERGGVLRLECGAGDADATSTLDARECTPAFSSSCLVRPSGGAPASNLTLPKRRAGGRATGDPTVSGMDRSRLSLGRSTRTPCGGRC